MIAFSYGKVRRDRRTAKALRRLAVLGDERFDCAPLSAKGLLRSVCARRWREFNSKIHESRGGMIGRIGSSCTHCEQGRKHWEGRT